MSESVGVIHYTIEAHTQKLLDSITPADQSLDRLKKTFDRTDKAANQANFQMTKTASAVKGLGRQSTAAATAMGSLSGLLSGLLTIRTAMAVIQTAEAYGEMSERIRMASSDMREYNMVQARLLETANNTYRSLSEAQEVYIRTADTLRSMGYTTSEVLDITDSLSYLFVTNASSAERAEGAISAYTKAMSKGKVEADAWESILAATPSIIGDISAATKISETEIRRLGASGKLAAEQLNQGLSQSLAKNREAAAGMATTVRDAFTALKNNIAVYLGETNKATEATGMLSSGILKIADAVKNSSIEELSREIESVKLSMEAISDLATEWLRPFMRQTNEATNLLPTSFARGVLATAKELDKLASFSSGVVGSIEGVWNALTSNIPAFFANAWSEVLVDSAAFVNKLADIVNKPIQALGGEGIGKVNFGGGSQQAIVNLADAAREGWEQASKSAGLYDKALIRLTAGTITRAAEAAELEYGEAIGETNKRKKKSVELTDEQKKAIKDLVKAREDNRKVIAKMAESLSQAALSGEALAVAQAKAQLNKFATPEDIVRIEALAVALSKVQQAEAARKKVGNTTREVEQYIFGDVKPLSGGEFDNQTERYDAEAKEEEKRYQAQLKRLQEAKDAEIQQRQAYAMMIEELQTAHLDRMATLELEKRQAKTEGDAQKLESDIVFEQTKYEDELARLQEHLEKKHQLQVNYAALEQQLGEETAARLAQIEKAKHQVLLSSAGDAFGALADVMKNSAGEQSGIYKAMFAASKAFAIAESIVKIQQGIANAAALPFPANIPAMATVAAQTASIVSTISGTGYGGGRQYGGPVGADKMYRINENGAPEILNTASGRQYLLPNSRGQVVSNKDATASASQATKITVVINNAPAGTQAEHQRGPSGEDIVTVTIGDIRSGGRISQAIEGTYGLSRRGT